MPCTDRAAQADSPGRELRQDAMVSAAARRGQLADAPPRRVAQALPDRGGEYLRPPGPGVVPERMKRAGGGGEALGLAVS